jgi:hypothetical protein
MSPILMCVRCDKKLNEVLFTLVPNTQGKKGKVIPVTGSGGP